MLCDVVGGGGRPGHLVMAVDSCLFFLGRIFLHESAASLGPAFCLLLSGLSSVSKVLSILAPLWAISFAFPRDGLVEMPGFGNVVFGTSLVFLSERDSECKSLSFLVPLSLSLVENVLSQYKIHTKKAHKS